MRRLAHAARQTRADIVLAHHYPAHWASAAIARHGRIPAVWLCNDWIYNPIVSRGGRRLRLAAKSLLRRFMIAVDARAARRHDMVLALSHMTGSQIASGYGIDVRVFRTGSTAPSPVVPSKHAAREKLGIPRNAFVASTVCILMPHRRVEDAILAVSALPNAVRARTLFIHAGGSDSPEYVAQLQRAVAESGTQHQVRFLGAVSEIERANLLSASDVFIFPVEGQSWGLAPFEAIASELPVIVSRSSGAAEVLRDGSTALLYDPGDVATLAKYIERLANEPALGEHLRRQGLRLWNTRFTWQRAARRMTRHLMRASSRRGVR
jgi:glycosyltransferase involved in cell wall biosynthesis